jgi:hypothetical protein
MTNLPRHPFWPDAAPQSLHVPMILGNVRDETRAFLDPRGPKLAGLTWDNLPQRMAAEVKIDLDPQWVVQHYRAQAPDWSVEQIYYAATTAGRSWPGQVIEADARAAAGAEHTWVYQLDRPSPRDPLRGAAHTDDLPYVFGTLDAPGSYSGTDATARAERDDDGGLCRPGPDRAPRTGDMAALSSACAGHDGVRRRLAHGGRSARLATPVVEHRALCPARQLGPSSRLGMLRPMLRSIMGTNPLPQRRYFFLYLCIKCQFL